MQSPALAQAWSWPSGKQLERKEPENPSGHCLNMSCPFLHRWQMIGCIRESTASSSREVIPPSVQHWWGHTWNTGSKCRLLLERHGHTGLRPGKDHRDDEGIWAADKNGETDCVVLLNSYICCPWSLALCAQTMSTYSQQPPSCI